jgi:Ion channel
MARGRSLQHPTGPDRRSGLKTRFRFSRDGWQLWPAAQPDLPDDEMTPSSPQEVVVLLPLAVSLATILGTIVVHAVALAAIAYSVRHELRLGRVGARFGRDLAIVAGATLLALLAHLVEIALWAVVLYGCGKSTLFGGAFYHSAENYTTLGYGDVLMSNSWKLLGPLEAANGMLMFGVSTATIFAIINILVQTRFGHVDIAIATRRSPPPTKGLGAAGR